MKCPKFQPIRELRCPGLVVSERPHPPLRQLLIEEPSLRLTVAHPPTSHAPAQTLQLYTGQLSIEEPGIGLLVAEALDPAGGLVKGEVQNKGMDEENGRVEMQIRQVEVQGEKIDVQNQEVGVHIEEVNMQTKEA